MDNYDLQKKITLNLNNELNGVVKVIVKIPKTGRKIEMNVPASSQKGSKIRAKGMGLDKPNGEKGDFYLVINHVIKPFVHIKNNLNTSSYDAVVQRELRPHKIAFFIGLFFLVLGPILWFSGVENTFSGLLLLIGTPAGLITILVSLLSIPSDKDRCKKCGSAKNRKIIETVFLYEENINIKKEVTDTVEHYNKYGVRNYEAGTDKIKRTVYVPGVRKHYNAHVRCQCGADWWTEIAHDYDLT